MGIDLFHSGSSNHTCPDPRTLTEDASNPLFGTTTFYQFNKIISGSCAAFACVAVGILIFMHATHLSKPSEQINIMRMCLIVPFYSVLSFLSICFPNAYLYINPWLEVVQGICLANFFLLLCHYISTDPRQREAFFASVNLPPNKKTGEVVDGVSWYRKTWILVIQYPIVAFVLAIASAITQAAHIYCLGSNKPYFAHLWITIIGDVSVVVAALRVLKFFMNLKTYLAGINPLIKFLSFKLIVAITFLESIIFMILRSTSILKTSSTLTWADVNIGIPTMVICMLMVPFSLFFHYAYSIKPYVLNKTSYPVEYGNYQAVTPQRYQGGLFNIKMWFSLFSIPDLIRGISAREPHPFVRGGETAYYHESGELQNTTNPLLYGST